jgi:PTS system fructose-specific IIC component
MKFVAVTACPTGIAHSAMAAESLEVAARAAGHDIEVEIQGAGGAVGIDPQHIAEADAVVFAVDAGIRNRERFAHLPAVEVTTRDAINRGTAVIAQAVEAAEQAPRAATATTAAPGPTATRSPMATKAPHASKAHQVRIWLMTGVSYMLPFVVAGGILIALGFAIGGATEVTQVEAWPTLSEAFGSRLMFGVLLFKIGAVAFSMLVPILAGFIAFGMVDRPGIAPGVVGGLIAIELDAGFIGGLAAGLLAGAVVMLLMKIKVKGALAKMMPVLVYPIVGTLVVGAALVLVIGGPIATLQTNLTDWLQGLSGTNAVLLGLLLGAMMALDMGGPINKTAYAFGIAALASGNYAVMAAVMVAGMTPPLGLALARSVRPSLFTEEEKEAGDAAWLLGLSFITEGALPFAAGDPLRVIPAVVAGSAVAGGLSMAFDAQLRAPHGGIFVVGLVDGKVGYLIAAVVGTLITAGITIGLKSLTKATEIDLTDGSAATAGSQGVLVNA